MAMAARMLSRQLAGNGSSVQLLPALSCCASLHTVIARLAPADSSTGDAPATVGDQNLPIAPAGQPAQQPQQTASATPPQGRSSATRHTDGQISGLRPARGQAPSGSQLRQQPGASQSRQGNGRGPPRIGPQSQARPPSQSQRPADFARQAQRPGQAARQCPH